MKFAGIKKTKRGIKNLIKWRKVIWNDFDWDSSSLFEIMSFKIKDMEKAFRSSEAIGKEADKIADEMKVCHEILDRLKDDVYFDIAFKEHEEKWGKLEMKPDEKGIIQFTRKNIKSKEDKDQESAETKICFKNEERAIQNDLEAFSYIFQNGVCGWWD